MNNLPFEQADYRQFQNTFLASTVVEMTFKPVELDKLYTVEWNKFTRALFSMDSIDGLFQKTIIVNRSDNRITFIFDKDRVQVKISGDGYRNYSDSLLPYAYKLKEFINDVVNIDKAVKLSVRKIDIFQIDTEKDTPSLEADVRGHFLSEKYLKLKDNRMDLDGDELEMPNMVKHHWVEDAYQLTLRSVFLSVPNKSKSYRLILDAEEQYAPVEGLELVNLDIELKKMNSDLFNVFIGCISDNVIKIMENGNE